MARSLKVLLVAEEAAGVQILRLLAESPHHIAGVVTASGSSMGSGATVATVASRFGIPVWTPRHIKEMALAEWVRREGIDLLLNVHALHVLPPVLVAAPRIGSFNLHPGPLPAYAGLNAPSWAIYHGERTHAVTVHWMDQGIDTGSIAYEALVEISEDDTGFSLTAKCVRAGLPLLQALLTAAANGTVPQWPQQQGIRRYYGREVPQGGRIDWTKPAARIIDFIRASDYAPFRSPWGHPAASIGGRELAVLKALRTIEPCTDMPGRVGRQIGDDILVAAMDHWVQVRRVRIGASVLPAGQVLQPGEQFDLPHDLEESSVAAR